MNGYDSPIFYFAMVKVTNPVLVFKVYTLHKCASFCKADPDRLNESIRVYHYTFSNPSKNTLFVRSS